MAFSQHQIDEIKSRLDMVRFMEQEFGLSLKKSGNSYKCPCPFHNGVKDNFDIRENEKLWKCWSDDCGGGDVFEALRIGRGMGFHEAVRYVADYIGYELKDRHDTKPFSASRDSTLFSSQMYKFFKMSAFDNNRDMFSYDLNLSRQVINGSMRCNPELKQGWLDRINSSPELLKAVKQLGFYNEHLGTLNENFQLQPLVRVRRLNLDFLRDDSIVQIIPGQELSSIEVNGFMVFDNEGEFKGTFPNDVDARQSIALPMLSELERIKMDNSVLTVVDNLAKYNEFIDSGNLNVVFVESTLTYDQMNSIMNLAPQRELILDCEPDYFKSSENRKSLFELAGRVSNKSFECSITFDNGSHIVPLWDYCYANLGTIDSQDELYSLKDILRNIINRQGYTTDNIKLLAKCIHSVSEVGLITADKFVNDYFNLSKVTHEDMQNYGEFVQEYSYERSEQIKRSLNYFDLTLENALALDLQQELTAMNKHSTKKLSM